jgi:transcriptional regulator with XRE-family HTH domain
LQNWLESQVQLYKENGSIDNPKLPVLQAIASALNVNPVWLAKEEAPMEVNINKNKVEINKEDFELINKYNSLDEKGKHTVNTVLNMEYNRCNNEICATAMVAESYDEYMPIAAHNDFADNHEEQRLMQEDLDEL